jgi:hypothetical protein
VKFIMTGQAIFEADGIGDALQKLSAHFYAVDDGQDDQLFLPGSDLSIKPFES